MTNAFGIVPGVIDAATTPAERLRLAREILDRHLPPALAARGRPAGFRPPRPGCVRTGANTGHIGKILPLECS
ncbi:hypothetical protein [Nocardia cyriacigeorgica]|uniref:hypothetical protein n=1 Tax=Nocardia cyriacigeorgica TaxID=135487 RepID=UPI00245723B3|nr:hypothetical protein [Nocardia cyriacigeorgica]